MYLMYIENREEGAVSGRLRLKPEMTAEMQSQRVTNVINWCLGDYGLIMLVHTMTIHTMKSFVNMTWYLLKLQEERGTAKLKY